MVKNKMRFLKSLLLLFGFASVVIPSCNSNASVTVTTPEASDVIATSTLEPAHAASPIQMPVIEQTHTPKPNDTPGLIVTLVGGGYADLGMPRFSPNGKIVALAGAVIRFWDANSHEMIRELKNPYGGKCFASSAQFSPDSKLFAMTFGDCGIITNSDDFTGHLLVWDISTGNLLQEWEQIYAKMPPSNVNFSDYTIPVKAMIFLPDSSGIIFANRNSLEIGYIFHDKKQDVLELGQEMYASQISISPDGKLVYVLMDWMKTNDLFESWSEQYKLQVWDVTSHTMIRENKYPESWSTLDLSLLGTLLVEKDYKKKSSQVTDLKTDEVKSMPYCSGLLEFYNMDTSLMTCEKIIDDNQVVEIWNTNSQEKVYTFTPDFEKDLIHSITGMAFNPGNTVLAIAHNDQISLWRIQTEVQP
jgi:WD40 repeat protein